MFFTGRFVLVEFSPNANEVICFETKPTPVEAVSRTGATQSISLEGRFTFDTSPKDAITGTLYRNDATKPLAGTYEIIKAPTGKIPPGHTVSPNDEAKIKIEKTTKVQDNSVSS